MSCKLFDGDALRRHGSVALIFLFIATGCVSMAPTYERPPLPVMDHYPLRMEEEVIGTGNPAAATDWHVYFSDRRLQDVIAQALENNRDLRIAVSRVEEARAAYGIQRAEQFPSIGLGVDASRSRIPGDLNLTGKPLMGNQFQVALGVSAWEIDFWGRVRSLKEAALESYFATDEAQQAVTVSLIAQVANSYLALRELDERLILARQTTASRAESLRIFRRRVEVGATSHLELTQVETLWQQATTLGAQLEQARATQANALTLLVGASVELGTPPEKFDDASVLKESAVGMPSDLLLDRPDIVAAEHQLKAANANIGAARAAFFPRIALTASYGTASAELDGLFGSGSAAWNFAPSLILPLFDGGLRRNNLSLAQARKTRAVAEYEKTIQEAFRDVADALAASHWLGVQVQTLQATRAVQTERARLAKLRYDNGAAAFLEVLDAQRDLLTVEQQWVQARRALLSSRVGLYAALGGGTHYLAAEGSTSPSASANSSAHSIKAK
ncbi:efflux transporter outer membrane subunit [Uliginosibacterium gangwonense]|uniref:efflux transporter outer membrane subunit n=1 Tax=Uliginosibacterium gangwonense TaxID=392736 RepID=UPI000526EEA3|nr:efflux transporter outer membrane subunit [Uliginosibacterium gangwonense]